MGIALPDPADRLGSAVLLNEVGTSCLRAIPPAQVASGQPSVCRACPEQQGHQFARSTFGIALVLCNCCKRTVGGKATAQKDAFIQLAGYLQVPAGAEGTWAA